MTEAEVIAWRVKPGDRVAIDEVIAEVETAKAVVEVPVPYAGVVAALHAEAGKHRLRRAAGLITVTTGLRRPDFTSPASLSADARADGEEASGSVLIGYGTTARRRAPRSRRPAAAGPLPRRATAAGRGPNRVAVISPLVRKEARDAGLDLTSITGTGPAGLVRPRGRPAGHRRTRLTAAASAAAGPHGGASRAADPAAAARGGQPPTSCPAPAGRSPRRPFGSTSTPPTWSQTRRALNAADPARPVSLLALLARFAVLGLRRYPELNARIEQDEIIVPERVNLGFAAQTDHGLVVPVVHDAHRLTTRDLSARLAERTTAARERRLAPADLAGGTFTVNNYGVFGVDGSAAIINHPEVAILGMGRVIDRPWVVDGQLTVRKVTELTLAFDHRACDGGTAGGFLRYVADCIESPAHRPRRHVKIGGLLAIRCTPV